MKHTASALASTSAITRINVSSILFAGHRKFDHDQFIAGASIKESGLLVACCIGTILSKVRVAVIRQRHHGNTAGECEDEDKCCDENLHGSSPLVRDFATAETAGMVTRPMPDSATFRFVFVFQPD